MFNNVDLEIIWIKIASSAQATFPMWNTFNLSSAVKAMEVKGYDFSYFYLQIVSVYLIQVRSVDEHAGV